MSIPLNIVPPDERRDGCCVYCGAPLQQDRTGLYCPPNAQHPFRFRPGKAPAGWTWARLHGAVKCGGSSKSRQKSPARMKADAALRRMLPGQRARAATIGDVVRPRPS